MNVTRRQALSAIGSAALLGGLAACSSGTGATSGGSGASNAGGSPTSAPAGTAASGAAASSGKKPLKSLTVSVGFQPFAAGNSPTTVYMQQQKLFETMGKKFNYDLKVDYKGYPAAAPMVPEMIAGRLDFGMWGDTPTITAVSQKQALTIISVGEGHMRFLVATRKESGITSPEDLKGKTIGVLLGGDPELAFLGILKGTLGTSDTAKLGIKMVNIPTQAAAATIPKGVDAAVVIYPALLKQQATDKDVIAIVDSYGMTAEGYDGPLGKGAGKTFPGAKTSPFAPEGFYAHRSMWIGRDAMIQSDPGVVSAFMAAEQESVAALTKMDPGKVSQLVKKYWGLSDADGAKIVQDELLFQRGFSWALHADAVDFLKLSEVMATNSVIKAPLTWSQLTANFEKGSAVAKAAYLATGSDPAESAFKPTKTDARGAPTWEANTWAAPAGQ